MNAQIWIKKIDIKTGINLHDALGAIYDALGASFVEYVTNGWVAFAGTLLGMCDLYTQLWL